MKHIKLYEEFSITGKKGKKKVKPQIIQDEGNKVFKTNTEILEHIYDVDRKGKRIFTYLHTTDEDTCKKVLKNGFEFYEFRQTTDEISDHIEDFNYKISLRTAYGECVLIIQTFEPIVDGEDVTIKEPFYSEEVLSMIYTLSPKHVRGYFNRKTGEFIENPIFELS